MKMMLLRFNLSEQASEIVRETTETVRLEPWWYTRSTEYIKDVIRLELYSEEVNRKRGAQTVAQSLVAQLESNWRGTLPNDSVMVKR